MEEKIVYGVISMPSNVFANTGTNVSVVFIDKSKQWETVSLVDASKLGQDTKIGGLKKTVLSDKDVEKIVETFRENKPVEDFSVAIPYSDFEGKGYSFSAGQYFDVKINYVDISHDDFTASIEGHKKSLKKLFDDGKILQEKIIKGLDSLKFNG